MTLLLDVIELEDFKAAGSMFSAACLLSFNIDERVDPNDPMRGLTLMRLLALAVLPLFN